MGTRTYSRRGSNGQRVLTAAGRVKFNQTTGLMEGYDIFGNPLPDVAPVAPATETVDEDEASMPNRTLALQIARRFPYSYEDYNPITSRMAYIPERSEVRDADTPLQNVDFLAQMVTRLVEKLQTTSPIAIDGAGVKELFERVESAFTVLDSAQRQIKRAYNDLEIDDDMDKYEKRIRSVGSIVANVTRALANNFENNIGNVLRSQNPDLTDDQIYNRQESIARNSEIGRLIENIGDFGDSFRAYMREGSESGFYNSDNLE